ncbi:hypothetical protein OAH18_03675 [bacterium]|nr:hypothetical protein [bacterium]
MLTSSERWEERADHDVTAFSLPEIAGRVAVSTYGGAFSRHSLFVSIEIERSQRINWGDTVGKECFSVEQASRLTCELLTLMLRTVSLSPTDSSALAHKKEVNNLGLFRQVDNEGTARDFRRNHEGQIKEMNVWRREVLVYCLLEMTCLFPTVELRGPREEDHDFYVWVASESRALEYNGLGEKTTHQRLYSLPDMRLAHSFAGDHGLNLAVPWLNHELDVSDFCGTGS